MSRITIHLSRIKATRAFSALLREREGTALIELAFVIPFLLMIVVGIINMGGLFFLQNNMVNVARDSARSLAIGAMTETEAETAATAALVNLTNATPTVDATVPVAVTDTDVTMTISVPMADAVLIEIPIVNFDSMTGTLEASVTMRYEG